MRIAANCFLSLLLLAACKKNSQDTVDPSTTAPSTGWYVSTQFAAAQVKTYSNVPYSTRPNWNGVQSTSEHNQPAEAGTATLKLSMDILVPPNASVAKPQPLMVYIHGGGFETGSKEDFLDDALTYARAGYVAAAINYRLTPNNQSSAALRQMAIANALDDAMNAIRYLKKNAAVYSIDATRVATIGSSAGGGISLINAIEFDTLLGTSNDYTGFSARVQAAVSTGATLLDRNSPSGSGGLLHFDASDTPVLLFHAKETDSYTGATWTNNVLPTQQRIHDSGNQCLLVAQPNLTHTVNLSLGTTYWQSSLKQFIWEKLGLSGLH